MHSVERTEIQPTGPRAATYMYIHMHVRTRQAEYVHSY